MEELRDENRELQLTIERLREKAERLTQEVTATIDQQERDFLNEVQHQSKYLYSKRPFLYIERATCKRPWKETWREDPKL